MLKFNVKITIKNYFKIKEKSKNAAIHTKLNPIQW